jgi:hypothetical protein
VPLAVCARLSKANVGERAAKCLFARAPTAALYRRIGRASEGSGEAASASQRCNHLSANIDPACAQAGPMTVHCEGDCRLLEQLGEKQDFEAELSRLGLGHEAFTLHVLRQTSEGRKAEPGQNYSVTVTNVVTERSHVYQGGPSLNWVRQFSLDLMDGVYRDPPRELSQ